MVSSNYDIDFDGIDLRTFNPEPESTIKTVALACLNAFVSRASRMTLSWAGKALTLVGLTVGILVFTGGIAAIPAAILFVLNLTLFAIGLILWVSSLIINIHDAVKNYNAMKEQMKNQGSNSI